MHIDLVLIPDGRLGDGQKASVKPGPINIKLHDVLSRRKARRYLDRKPAKRRDDGESFAPAPLNKGGGDDDFPSAAGAAETIISARKRKDRLSING